jgi:hypothetical protein
LPQEVVGARQINAKTRRRSRHRDGAPQQRMVPISQSGHENFINGLQGRGVANIAFRGVS